MTVDDQVDGSIEVELKAPSSDLLEPQAMHYDVQVKIGEVISTRIHGVWHLIRDITQQQ